MISITFLEQGSLIQRKNSDGINLINIIEAIFYLGDQTLSK